MAKGTDEACITCHANAPSDDYVCIHDGYAKWIVDLAYHDLGGATLELAVSVFRLDALGKPNSPLMVVERTCQS